MKKSLIAVALCLMIAPLVSCGGGGDVPPPTPTEKEFKDAYFNSLTVDYDGKEHTLAEVGGVPEDTKIVYDGRIPHIDVGTYEASATLSKEGYKTKTLSATLTIKGQEFKDVYFDDVTINYDGKSHSLGEVRGAPEGTNIVYDGRNEYTDVGTYSATATLTKPGYATKTLTATLTILGQEFVGVTFNSKEVVYDAQPHILDEVTGAPEGTSITYTGRNNQINAGTYDATATLVKQGFNTKTLSASLIISKAEFEGLTYESKSVIYDGQDHIHAVQLVGILPPTAHKTEIVKNSSGQQVKEAKEVGIYYYHVEVTDNNYVTYTNDATLTIKKDKTDMAVFASSDGSIYFANGIDNRYLYSLSNGVLKFIDYSTPKEFNKYSSTKAIYIAGTPLLNVVKEINNDETNVVYTSGNIDDFVKYNDSIFYYSSNSLTTENSGIYKVDATNGDDEPIVTKIFQGKTNNLAIYGNNLYFINKSDDYVYKINLGTTTSTLVLEEKVHEFTLDNNKLYCTVNDPLNDYIGYIDLSSGTPKIETLTNAAGEFLTIKNGNLYYNYTDLFGVIDPDNYGIWSIDLSSKVKTHHVNTFSVNGFDVESKGSIVYIDTNDLHLYRYDPSSKSTTDLLKGFEPEERTPLNTGGRTVAVDGKIYFLNMYAGKTLWVYNENTKGCTQLSTNKVVDFFIYENKLYFNQVTRLTNNDLYVADLNLSSKAQKISTNDIRDMVSDGTYIYGVHYDWAGLAAGLARMKMDGSEYVKFSEVNGAKNLTIRDNKLYYINCTTGQDNGNIEYIDLSLINPAEGEQKLKGTILGEGKIKNVRQFIFDSNNIFYIYDTLSDNSIRRTDFTSLGAGTEIAKTGTNPYEIIMQGDYIYYYSYPTTKPTDAGFYIVDKYASDESTITPICACDDKYYGSSIELFGNNLYFLNYIKTDALLPKILGDAHTYQLNINTKVVTKIA